MIPASYLYKDIYVRAWGDPEDSRAEHSGPGPRGPDRGQLIGVIGLLARVLPLRLERSHRWARVRL